MAMIEIIRQGKADYAIFKLESLTNRSSRYNFGGVLQGLKKFDQEIAHWGMCKRLVTQWLKEASQWQ